MRRKFQAIFSYFAPEAAASGPDELRRTQLIVAFSILGVIFGSIFAGLYFLIDHLWGAGIVAICVGFWVVVPFLLKSGVSSERAGNFYCLILFAGFMCLCWVEGGMHGHAVAWLVIIPLVGLLLTSRRGAYVWSIISFLGALFTVGAEAFGVTPPILYPMEWHVVISAMGYSSLVLFLFALGLIFEVGRQTAHDKMQALLTQLESANERLTKLNSEKSEFLGIAAHDLRSPLTIVLGCSELLTVEAGVSERAKKIAGSIMRESQRMRRLIGDLLDLNAIEEGRMNISIAPMRLGEAVDSLLENHGKAASTKGISFKSQIDREATLLADDKALLQILDNLVSNAIKFTKPGGSVEFTSVRSGDRVVIRVSDSGPGISAADQAKLFGRFARLSARPTGGESSHGLGLSIVKRLIDAMNGTIRVESELGKGTVFILELQVAPAGIPVGEQGVPEVVAS